MLFLFLRFLNSYLPPIYKKFRKTLIYYSTNAWDLTKEYSIFIWKASEDYRNSVYDISIQAKKYVSNNYDNNYNNN